MIGNKINDKTYIPLPPFKGFVLENFPFIEADFDAITNYQLLCKVIESLNNVIANQNTVQELGSELVGYYNALVDAVNLAISDFETDVTADINQFKLDVNDEVTSLSTQFTNLKNYVDNFFDTLDVQEEVDNKLDDMVEDGTLETIVGSYVSIIGTNVKSYGALGDGINDDTEAIQDTIDYAKTHNLSKIIFPKGVYKITDELEIDFSNLTLEGVDDATLMYYGNGTTGNIIKIKGTNASNYIENITINNLKIDGTNQVYKGGYSMDTPSVTHTNPAYPGLICINVEFVKNMKISNCILNDVYGDGIKISHSTNVKVLNNTLYDVSSGNIQQSGQTGYDTHGDGIVAFSSYNIIFDNNTIVNERVYADGIEGAIGKPCGRSGLEFEYAINTDYTNDDPDDPLHNAPDFDLIPTIEISSVDYRVAFALTIKNNYVYGYTKGIHVENVLKSRIINNDIVYNHIGILASVWSGTIISGNYCNTFNVGPAPQSGYDGYYGCIAITEYGVNARRYGFIINNNILEGNGKGVILGSPYVTISNNTFKSKYGVYTKIQKLDGINVIGNTFNSINVDGFSSFLFLYHVNSALVDGNSFYSPTGNTNEVDGKNIKISNNTFFNTCINQQTKGENNIIENNTFKGDSYANIPLMLNNITNSYIGNNVIDISHSSADSRYGIQSVDNSVYTTYENNTIYINSTRTTAVFVPSNCEECNFIGNRLYGNANDIKFIVAFEFKGGTIKNNIVENTMGKVFHANGSFNRIVVVDKNIGKFSADGWLPNNSLERFNNTYFTLSQKVYKYAITNSSTNIGWICVSGGWYVTTTWATDTSYNLNTKLKNSSDNVYQCITKGSGNATVEPTHTTNANVTGADGYEWKYLGSIAVLKDLPL